MEGSNTEERPKASKEQILGTSAPAAAVRPKWKKHQSRLLRPRERVLGQKADLARDAREEKTSFSLHMADAGTDEYDVDFALSMISADQDALFEIEQALNRIANGTYGQCELTGETISNDRLEALPWTRFSKEAQERLEKEGSFAKTGLKPASQIRE